MDRKSHEAERTRIAQEAGQNRVTVDIKTLRKLWPGRKQATEWATGNALVMTSDGAQVHIDAEHRKTSIPSSERTAPMRVKPETVTHRP